MYEVNFQTLEDKALKANGIEWFGNDYMKAT